MNDDEYGGVERGALKHLDALPEILFDTILDCAARLLGCEGAAVLLQDGAHGWFKAVNGLASQVRTEDHGLIADAVAFGESVIVPDSAADPRFSAHLNLDDGSRIGAFAAVPLRRRPQADAPVVGALCVFVAAARVLPADTVETLGRLAEMAGHLLDVRTTAAETAALLAARHQAMIESDRWQRHFKLTEKLVNIGSWHLDLTTGLVEWSPHTFLIFGRDDELEAPDLETILNHYPVKDREVLMQAIDRAIGTGETYDLETDIITQGGLKRRIRNLGEVRYVDGEPVGLFGVSQDVTERYYVEQALERSAKIDELTQIPNRAALNARLDELIADRTSAAPGLVLLMIDLDNFKKLNDTYGHPAGDYALKAMADKLSAHADRLGFTARLGGDEFVLVITNELAMRDVRSLLADLLVDLRVDYDGDQGVIRVAATLGGCWLDGDVPTRAELLKRADLSLYSAKALGKGRAIVSGDMRPILPADQQQELRAAG